MPTPTPQWNDIAPGCVKDGVPTLECLPAVFTNVVHGALLFSGLVALIFIIVGGIKFIRSEGDPKQAESARHTVTYAVLGLFLVLLSFFILGIIAFITRQECITQFGFTNCQ